MSFRLTIPNPCEQKWDLMAPSNKGKYCSHCQKTVIDFSRLSDNEIINIVAQTPGKICGRLTQQQINYHFSNDQKLRRLLLHKIFAGIAIFGISNESSAFSITTTYENASIIQEKITLNPRDKSTITTDTLKNVIEGTVFDAQTKETVPFSNLIIEGTTIGSQADANGKFVVIIPDSLVGEKITLVVNSVTYDNFQFQIERSELPFKKDIFLNRIESTEIMVVGALIVTQKKHWWQFWKKSCP